MSGQKCLNHMENRLTPAVVSTWFDDAEVVELNEQQLILYTPSPFRKEIIQRRCTEYIKDAMKEIFNTEITLVVFGPEELAEYKARGRPIPSWISIPIHLRKFRGWLLQPVCPQRRHRRGQQSRPGLQSSFYLWTCGELERPICSMPLPMSFAASTQTLKSFTSRATNLPMS